MSSEGCGSLGRDSSPRSRAHVSADCAEVQPRVCDWISEGKSAVRIHRELMSAHRVKGMHFWSRGYCVSTVGLDELTVRKYIRHQEEEEKRQLDLELE